MSSHPDSFHAWLASVLGQNLYSAQVLLKDRTALRFLITWSLFESKLASGRFGAKKLLQSDFYPEASPPELADLRQAARWFHTRYQQPSRLEALAPREDRVRAVFEKVELCLGKSGEQLNSEESAFLCAFVASRVRNNMFHGVKGIDDWLQDKPLIEKSTNVLMVLVSAKERASPTLVLQAA